MTKEELEEMGVFGVGDVSELAAKNTDSKTAFNQAHHAMMSGSNCLFIIEPASKEEIETAHKRLNSAIVALAAKGIDVDCCTFEDAVAKRAKGLYEEFELAGRALKRLENTEFSETAKSYLDEIIAQRRRVFNPERPRAFKGNAATEWGNSKELEAIAAFEALTGLKLEKTGDKQEFIRLGYVESVDFDFSEWFGCTPDSVTKESVDYTLDASVWGWLDKAIPREFKNPSSGVVFDRYRELKTPLDLKKENNLYYWQCIAQMAVLGAPYMQWIAHDCDIKSDNPADKFVVIDFERDMEVERVLVDSLFKAVQYIKERV